jgi:hypothetical protein
VDLNPSGGKKFSIFPTCLNQPWGSLSFVYKGKWPTFLGVQQSGLELITHPNLVLILRISIAIPLLLLCATIGMIWSDLQLVHVFGSLFMNSMFMYLHKTKATNNKVVKSCEFTRLDCFFLSSNSYWEKGKRAQFNVLFQNTTHLFFSCKRKNW